jgi:hypothetical protein
VNVIVFLRAYYVSDDVSDSNHQRIASGHDCALLLESEKETFHHEVIPKTEIDYLDEHTVRLDGTETGTYLL